MAISFFSARDLDKNLKCTIHKSGKLGFSESAKKKLGLKDTSYILIGKNDDPKDDSLYLTVKSGYDEHGFKISKNGNYYNINTKPLFDKLGVDYANAEKPITFDMHEVTIDGQKMYRMVKRKAGKNITLQMA